ncbi:hypothetical protein Fmac_032446 [Flemingia macrophylla]|uniref:LisH domain-containing protein n=1 Tax=Flemingia macrophylla TaxID=520843 RepID=A0ABD1L4W8_9FABA
MTNSRNLQRSKISPCQVAIHVQRYLILNNFTNSASHFRQEAGTLIAEAMGVPSSVLCLGQMLDEYALLKEQKVFLDQEWATLTQEKINFEMMVQNFMSKYSISQMSQAPMMITNCARVPQPCVSIVATGLSPTMDSTVAATYNVDPTPALIPIEEVAVNPTQKIGHGDYCTSPVTDEPGMVDPAKGVLDSFRSDFD